MYDYSKIIALNTRARKKGKGRGKKFPPLHTAKIYEFPTRSEWLRKKQFLDRTYYIGLSATDIALCHTGTLPDVRAAFAKSLNSYLSEVGRAM